MFKRWLMPKHQQLVEKSADTVKSAVVQTAGRLTPTGKSPDESLRGLFDEVQERKVYKDGKEFADMVPRQRIKALIKMYEHERTKPDFNLQDFVDKNFYKLIPNADLSTTYTPSNTTTTRQHITNLWPVLRHRNRKERGSLTALPYEYVVPGGRFSEQYYWDSFFTMLGLAGDEQWNLIEAMMKNYNYMLLKYGRIPTANRTYYISRSQPPFFAYMVKLLAGHKGRLRTYAEYLPALLIEYRFWMRGKKDISEDADKIARLRVVCMPNGVVLNRYFDEKSTPRPEMKKDDLDIASHAKTLNKQKVYLDLRAAAESGWDFSSRWFDDDNKITSIHTTDIVAVDLNCLLYNLEQTIAECYGILKQPLLARKFLLTAEKRANAVRSYCWNDKTNFFEDYNFRQGQTTSKLTLAGVYPLYAKIATTEQASAVARRIEKDFLKPGGLVTSLIETGEQWDYPNGWAPLQWVTIQGLKAYGYHSLANKISSRWLKLNEDVFIKTKKMIEKYNVIDATSGGGGEYALQDGFGWTNGVYATLYDERLKTNGK